MENTANSVISQAEKNHLLVVDALQHIRAPYVPCEYDLHKMVAQCLEEAEISCSHEVKIGSRRRIDFVAMGVGIEVKKGKINSRTILQQLKKYAESEQIISLVLLSQCHCDVPDTILGKRVTNICLNRLWGIAL